MGLLEELRGILGAQPAPTTPPPAPPRAPRVLPSVKERGLPESTISLVATTLDPQHTAERESDPDTIAKLREAVRDKVAVRVKGMTIDVFSASAVIQIYDGLSETNQRKMGALPIKKMMDVVFKMLAKRTG